MKGQRQRYAPVGDLIWRRAARLNLALLGALALLLTLGAGISSAASYAPGTPASFCSGTGAAAGECGELKGIAVDTSNGNIYVVDTTNNRVNEFDASGAFVQAFGVDVIPGGAATAESCTTGTTCQAGLTTGAGAIVGVQARSIAVDPETHVVYVLAGLTRVAYFNGTTGAFIGQTEGNTGEITTTAPEKFANSTGLAVDTSDPQHYLYVAIRLGAGLTPGKIDKFQISAAGVTAGSYVCQITGTAVNTSATSSECGGNGVAAHKDGIFEGIDTGTGPTPAQQGGNLAVDAAGNVFVAEKVGVEVAGQPDRHYVSKFDKTGNFVSQFKPCCGTPTLSVNEPRPAALATLPSGNVLVAAGGSGGATGGTRIQEYNPASPGSPITEFGFGTITGSFGVAVSGTDVYVADKAGKKVWKYSAVNQFTLSVTKSGTGTGTVTSSPAGINCGATCSALFNESSMVTLTPTPAGDSNFVEWTGACTGAGACVVTMSAAKSVDAKFDLKPGKNLKVLKTGTGTGTVTSDKSGTAAKPINCGSECQEVFIEGEVVTLTAVSGANTKTVAWEGCELEPTPSECKVTMSDIKEVKAKFDLEQHLLSVTKSGLGTGTVTSSPAGISCDPTCSAPFDHNALVTLTPTADPGSKFKEWTGACTGTGACVVTMSAAKSVDAVFIKTFTLTVTKSGAGAAGGTVTSSPAGINCGATCSFPFDEGEVVTLSHSEAPGTKFKEWTGACTGTGACVVTMSAAKSVDAVFIKTFTLTVIKSGAGASGGTVTSSPAAINCAPTCAADFDEGTVVTLSHAETAGTKFKEWTGACTGTGACVVTMSSSKSVGAVFTKTFALTVTKGGAGASGGTVTSSPAGINCAPTCAADFDEGTVVTLSHSEAAGTKFKEWTGACTGTGACVVTMSAAKAVTATFIKTFTLTVSKAGTGSGAVSCDSGACLPTYDEGTKVTLAAAPDASSNFSGWSGACTGAGTCQVTMSEARSVTATFVTKPPHVTPPPTVDCVVPKLAGKTLAQAKSALTAANCTLGKVTKPKAKKGKKLGPLVVKSSTPAAGATLPQGAKVNLKLAKKPKKKAKKSSNRVAGDFNGGVSR